MVRKRFWVKSPVDSADTLGVKNSVEIALSHTISEIGAFLRLTLKFEMAAKNGGEKQFLGQIITRLCTYYQVPV